MGGGRGQGRGEGGYREGGGRGWERGEKGPQTRYRGQRETMETSGEAIDEEGHVIDHTVLSRCAAISRNLRQMAPGERGHVTSVVMTE